MPGPFDFIRLAALSAFLALVAVGLWLLDVAWWVIPPVMVVALLVAWTIEWLAWRQTQPLPTLATALEEIETVPPRVAEPPPPPAQAIQPPAPPEPEPVPEPVPVPEPAPEPEREPEPVPETPPEPVATPADEPEKPARRPRRVRLRPVPAPRPPAEPGPAPVATEARVAELRPRTFQPKQWNLWDLERIAREQRTTHPERRDEWSYLFIHLRQFADADGSLPTEFDGLVRESFGSLLEPSQRP